MLVEWDWNVVSFEPSSPTAGFLTISVTDIPLPTHHEKIAFAIHFDVGEKFRCWGYEQGWYDGPIHHFGLGRFILFVWHDDLE